MVARFCRFLTLAALVAAVAVSCTRETPLQPSPPRANVIAQDTGGPPPPNDNRDSARTITFLPYFDSTDVTNATIEPGEARSACHDTIGSPTRTVWYFFTPSTAGTMQLRAQLFGPAPGILSVYLVSADTLLTVGCNSNFGPVTFFADSGSGFLFQISDSAGAAGPTVFSLQQDTMIPPPPPPPVGNDLFADARVVPSVPYSDTADFTFASLENGEPFGCFFQSRSVWYVFHPSQTRAVQVNVQSPFFNGFTVWTGTSLGNLGFVRCGSNFNPQTFTAVAGATYYIQVLGDQPGTAIFSLQPPPPPQANFSTNPFDPSSFDNIQFFDQSFDPGGIGIQSQQWNFGDGATATGFAPTHRYAADGDYQVSLTVTTFDGRTGSISRILQVRTHDVAITRFATPATGMTGRTSRISVDIRSNRYPETVQVELYKSVPGGLQLVSSTVQTLPTRDRVTSVLFSYTFTADDAVIGKVSFRARVNILGARDALPADNEAIGDPTKVMR